MDGLLKRLGNVAGHVRKRQVLPNLDDEEIKLKEEEKEKTSS